MQNSTPLVVDIHAQHSSPRHTRRGAPFGVSPLSDRAELNGSLFCPQTYRSCNKTKKSSLLFTLLFPRFFFSLSLSPFLSRSHAPPLPSIVSYSHVYPFLPPISPSASPSPHSPLLPHSPSPSPLSSFFFLSSPLTSAHPLSHSSHSLTLSPL